jgi:hypothetical protein
MAADDLVELELMLNRFRRLLGELVHGTLARNSFLPWEIELILDFAQCSLPPRRRSEILQQYVRAVTRQMETGPGPPMKLSAFVAEREQRRQGLRPSGPGAPQSDTCRPTPSG